MVNLAFDTHKFVRDLTKANMPEAQAEVLAQHYANLLDDRLATKDDLRAQEERLNGKIESLRSELMAEIETVRLEAKADNALLRKDLQSLEDRLNSKIMTTVLTAQITSIVIICTVVGVMLRFT